MALSFDLVPQDASGCTVCSSDRRSCIRLESLAMAARWGTKCLVSLVPYVDPQ
jgi:hypothetical protein